MIGVVHVNMHVKVHVTMPCMCNVWPVAQLHSASSWFGMGSVREVRCVSCQQKSIITWQQMNQLGPGLPQLNCVGETGVNGNRVE